MSSMNCIEKDLNNNLCIKCSEGYLVIEDHKSYQQSSTYQNGTKCTPITQCQQQNPNCIECYPSSTIICKICKHSFKIGYNNTCIGLYININHSNQMLLTNRTR